MPRIRGLKGLPSLRGELPESNLMNRAAYIRALTRALGRRRVVYFGTRGADARSLSYLMNFDAIFSQIAPSGLGAVEEVCLETLTGRRVDLDAYSVDTDRSNAVAELRAAMLRAFEVPTVVLPYRSCGLLASAWFPRSEKVIFAGNFHELQGCFEHKPWVETQLAGIGIQVVPWRYYADNERALIEEALHFRPLVVRSNRSDGGTGVRYVATAADLDEQWPEHVDGFLAAAPFLEGVPINVNAVVFGDGSVTRHGASVQLIGIPQCTHRRFGYCGNDFGAAAEFEPRQLADLDTMVERVGEWLAGRGYRGAFGIDAILAENGVHLVELNPRFQGSSRLSAKLDEDAERADMFLSHLGAYLNLEPPDGLTLAELAPRARGAHVVVHATGDRLARRDELPPPEADLLPEPGVLVVDGAMTANLVFRELVSVDGTSLSPGALRAIEVLGG